MPALTHPAESHALVLGKRIDGCMSAMLQSSDLQVTQTQGDAEGHHPPLASEMGTPSDVAAQGDQPRDEMPRR